MNSSNQIENIAKCAEDLIVADKSLEEHIFNNLEKESNLHNKNINLESSQLTQQDQLLLFNEMDKSNKNINENSLLLTHNKNNSVTNSDIELMPNTLELDSFQDELENENYTSSKEIEENYHETKSNGSDIDPLNKRDEASEVMDKLCLSDDSIDEEIPETQNCFIMDQNRSNLSDDEIPETQPYLTVDQKESDITDYKQSETMSVCSTKMLNADNIFSDTLNEMDEENLDVKLNVVKEVELAKDNNESKISNELTPIEHDNMSTKIPNTENIFSETLIEMEEVEPEEDNDSKINNEAVSIEYNTMPTKIPNSENTFSENLNEMEGDILENKLNTVEEVELSEDLNGTKISNDTMSTKMPSSEDIFYEDLIETDGDILDTKLNTVKEVDLVEDRNGTQISNDATSTKMPSADNTLSEDVNDMDGENLEDKLNTVEEVELPEDLNGTKISNDTMSTKMPSSEDIFYEDLIETDGDILDTKLSTVKEVDLVEDLNGTKISNDATSIENEAMSTKMPSADNTFSEDVNEIDGENLEDKLNTVETVQLAEDNDESKISNDAVLIEYDTMPTKITIFNETLNDILDESCVKEATNLIPESNVMSSTKEFILPEDENTLDEMASTLEHEEEKEREELAPEIKEEETQVIKEGLSNDSMSDNIINNIVTSENESDLDAVNEEQISEEHNEDNSMSELLVSNESEQNLSTLHNSYKTVDKEENIDANEQLTENENLLSNNQSQINHQSLTEEEEKLLHVESEENSGVNISVTADAIIELESEISMKHDVGNTSVKMHTSISELNSKPEISENAETTASSFISDNTMETLAIDSSTCVMDPEDDKAILYEQVKADVQQSTENIKQIDIDKIVTADNEIEVRAVKKDELINEIQNSEKSQNKSLENKKIEMDEYVNLNKLTEEDNMTSDATFIMTTRETTVKTSVDISIMLPHMSKTEDDDNNKEVIVLTDEETDSNTNREEDEVVKTPEVVIKPASESETCIELPMNTRKRTRKNAKAIVKDAEQQQEPVVKRSLRSRKVKTIELDSNENTDSKKDVTSNDETLSNNVISELETTLPVNKNILNAVAFTSSTPSTKVHLPLSNEQMSITSIQDVGLDISAVPVDKPISVSRTRKKFVKEPSQVDSISSRTRKASETPSENLNTDKNAAAKIQTEPEPTVRTRRGRKASESTELINTTATTRTRGRRAQNSETKEVVDNASVIEKKTATRGRNQKADDGDGSKKENLKDADKKKQPTRKRTKKSTDESENLLHVINEKSDTNSVSAEIESPVTNAKQRKVAFKLKNAKETENVVVDDEIEVVPTKTVRTRKPRNAKNVIEKQSEEQMKENVVNETDDMDAASSVVANTRRRGARRAQTIEKDEVVETGKTDMSETSVESVLNKKSSGRRVKNVTKKLKENEGMMVDESTEHSVENIPKKRGRRAKTVEKEVETEKPSNVAKTSLRQASKKIKADTINSESSAELKPIEEEKDHQESIHDIPLKKATRSKRAAKTEALDTQNDDDKKEIEPKVKRAARGRKIVENAAVTENIEIPTTSTKKMSTRSRK